MKKLGILLIMLISASAFSQGNPHSKKGQTQNFELSSKEMAALQSKRLALRLDLSENQRNEVEELFIQRANERKAIIAERKKVKEREVENQKAEHFRRMNSRLDRQIAYQKKMKEILNKNQYALLKQNQHKPKRKMHKKRMSRR